MKQKGRAIIWIHSLNRGMLVFSPPRLLIYIAVITLGVSWAMVAGGGYLGDELYRNYLQLKEQNTRLLEKKKEWDDLKLDMRRVQKKRGVHSRSSRLGNTQIDRAPSESRRHAGHRPLLYRP